MFFTIHEQGCPTSRPYVESENNPFVFYVCAWEKTFLNHLTHRYTTHCASSQYVPWTILRLDSALTYTSALFQTTCATLAFYANAQFALQYQLNRQGRNWVFNSYKGEVLDRGPDYSASSLLSVTLWTTSLVSLGIAFALHEVIMNLPLAHTYNNVHAVHT